jgi:hypothetical protein
VVEERPRRGRGEAEERPRRGSPRIFHRGRSGEIGYREVVNIVGTVTSGTSSAISFLARRRKLDITAIIKLGNLSRESLSFIDSEFSVCEWRGGRGAS